MKLHGSMEQITTLKANPRSCEQAKSNGTPQICGANNKIVSK